MPFVALEQMLRENQPLKISHEMLFEGNPSARRTCGRTRAMGIVKLVRQAWTLYGAAWQLHLSERRAGLLLRAILGTACESGL